MRTILYLHIVSNTTPNRKHSELEVEKYDIKWEQ